ncbi:alanine-zipper protein [Litorivivens sp.]|uniref:alanine-zipper protein n=1 Tax=Litorivivens sp. TaxID=2020868 RepID=UPI003565AA8E
MKHTDFGSSLKAGALVALLAFTTGCASTSEIQQANATAESALQAAQQAQRTAEEALRKAEAAQRCCDDNTKKIDRAFERAQQK